MGFDITYPKIDGKTDSEKIEQTRSYLYQLADQLKYALNASNGGSSENAQRASTIPADAVGAQATFNAVKALILNSADILNAYYNKLDKKFEERYVTKKDGAISITDAVIEKKLTLGKYVLDSAKSLDFVTETGESGNWKYQKYASGFIVAYGSFTAKYQCNTAHGSVFYAPGTFSLPSGMFTSIWNVASSVVASNGVRGITISTVTNDEITASVYSMVEDTEEASVRIDLTVTGFKNTAGG